MKSSECVGLIACTLLGAVIGALSWIFKVNPFAPHVTTTTTTTTTVVY